MAGDRTAARDETAAGPTTAPPDPTMAPPGPTVGPMTVRGPASGSGATRDVPWTARPVPRRAPGTGRAIRSGRTVARPPARPAAVAPTRVRPVPRATCDPSRGPSCPTAAALRQPGPARHGRAVRRRADLPAPAEGHTGLARRVAGRRFRPIERAGPGTRQVRARRSRPPSRRGSCSTPTRS
jgi:hypothetical protein